MDPIKTGELIRALRRGQHLTQLALAEQIGVSDKAVSKWERGCGAPDIALLPALTEALHIDMAALLRGDLAENERTNGDMKKLKWYVCPTCGNLINATDAAEVTCCGQRLEALTPQKADEDERLTVTESDGDWYVTTNHPMTREHYLAFVALIDSDTLIVKKRYPEWSADARLPRVAHGTLLWYCTRHGLFYQPL